VTERRNAATAPEAPPPSQTAGKARGVRLRSSANVRAELARTYRAFKAGEIDGQAARTRGFLLQTLAGVIRDEIEVEKLAAIEAQLATLTAEVKR
jgi:hypothetical protein